MLGEESTEKFARVQLLNGQQYVVSLAEADLIRGQMSDTTSPIVEFQAKLNKNDVFVTALKTALVAIVSDIEDD